MSQQEIPQQLQINVQQLMAAIVLHLGVEVQVKDDAGLPSMVPAVEVTKSEDGLITQISLPYESYARMDKIAVSPGIQAKMKSSLEDAQIVLSLTEMPKHENRIQLANESDLRGINRSIRTLAGLSGSKN